MKKSIKDKLDSFGFSLEQQRLLVDVIKEIASDANVDTSQYATKEELNKINTTVNQMSTLAGTAMTKLNNVYTKTETNSLLETKANSADVPTKVSELERDDVYYINISGITENSNDEMTRCLGTPEEFEEAFNKNKVFYNVLKEDDTHLRNKHVVNIFKATTGRYLIMTYLTNQLLQMNVVIRNNKWDGFVKSIGITIPAMVAIYKIKYDILNKAEDIITVAEMNNIFGIFPTFKNAVEHNYMIVIEGNEYYDGTNNTLQNSNIPVSVRAGEEGYIISFIADNKLREFYCVCNNGWTTNNRYKEYDFVSQYFIPGDVALITDVSTATEIESILGKLDNYISNTQCIITTYNGENCYIPINVIIDNNENTIILSFIHNGIDKVIRINNDYGDWGDAQDVYSNLNIVKSSVQNNENNITNLNTRVAALESSN